MAGHAGQRKLYDSMRRELYWPHTTKDFYTTVCHCSACAQNRMDPKPRKKLQLFLANGRLKFIVIDIFGALPLTAGGSQYVIVMISRYLRLLRALPAGKMSSAHVSNVFFNF